MDSFELKSKRKSGISIFRSILFALAGLLICSGQSFSDDAVTISHIDGLDSARGVMIDVKVRYYVNFEIGPEALSMFGNGFRIYSPEDASWESLSVVEIINWSEVPNVVEGGEPGYYEISPGIGVDTVGAFGFSPRGTMAPSGYISDIFYIETKLSGIDVGNTLCMDSSSFYDRNGVFNPWLWEVFPSGQTVIPAWGGPYCYEIVDCCRDTRGDINGDGVGSTVLDLVILVNYIFRAGAAPICKNSADVNSDGVKHNLLDLIFLVNHIYRGGPPPGACP